MAEDMSDQSLRLMLARLAVAENSDCAAARKGRLRCVLDGGLRLAGNVRAWAGRCWRTTPRRPWRPRAVTLRAKIEAGKGRTSVRESVRSFMARSQIIGRLPSAEVLRGRLAGHFHTSALLARRTWFWARQSGLQLWQSAAIGSATGRSVPVRGSTAQSIRHHMRASLIATAILVVLVGGWASTAEFAAAVIAPGSLVVDSNVKKLQHPTGGIVDELLVSEGAKVKQGDVLIRLDRTQTGVNLAIVAKSLDELLVRQARLEVERDGAQAFNVPSDLQTRATQDAELARVISGENRLFETRRTSRGGQRSQLRERISQLNEQILGLEGQMAAKKREATLIEKELVGVQELHRKNLIPIQRVTALERDAARIEGEHGAMAASIAQTRARITETELQVLQIEQDLQSEVGRELADVRAKIAELSERKIGAEDQLRRVDIKAPLDGVVHQLAVHTIGGVVGAGDVLMLIVPDADDLSVEVRLPPERIDQVHAGQPAALRFSAFNQRSTPEVNGEVSRVSADLLTDQRTGMGYYLARISIPATERRRLRQKLLPGMPVEAFIHTGDRTVLTYLTKPFTDQMRRAFRER